MKCVVGGSIFNPLILMDKLMFSFPFPTLILAGRFCQGGLFPTRGVVWTGISLLVFCADNSLLVLPCTLPGTNA